MNQAWCVEEKLGEHRTWFAQVLADSLTQYLKEACSQANVNNMVPGVFSRTGYEEDLNRAGLFNKSIDELCS